MQSLHLESSELLRKVVDCEKAFWHVLVELVSGHTFEVFVGGISDRDGEEEVGLT